MRVFLSALLASGLAAQGAAIPVSAGSPAATKSPLAVLRGGGVEVELDTSAFQGLVGLEQLGKTYFSLGLFALKSEETVKYGGLPLNLSVLVDDLPKGVTSIDQLQDHALKSYKKRAEGQDLSPLSWKDRAGFSFSYFAHEQAAGIGDVLVFNYYFETMCEKKWVELHFSTTLQEKDLNKVLPQADLVVAVVKSMKTKLSPNS